MGGVVLLVAHQLLVRCSLQDRLFQWTSSALTDRLPTLLFFSFGLFVPLLLILTRSIDGDDAGTILGLNLAFLLVMSRGLPDDAGTLPQRTARVLLGYLIFFTAQFIVDLGLDLVGLDDDLEWVECIESAVSSFIALWGTVTVCLRLRLYDSETRRSEIES